MTDTSEYTAYLKIRDIGLQSNGDYRLEVDLETIHLSRAGLVHGGMVFTLLDAAMGRAIRAQIPPEYNNPTIELKINYFRPAASGRLTCHGRVVNRSKQICYAEGEVTNEEGKLIARATGTFFCKVRHEVPQ